MARTDATLGVRQQPSAVYNEHTGQYHVELSCSSRGKPPAVIVVTPSQQTLQSSDERHGDTFSLLLPNPVSGGNYTCRVPPDSPPATCLPRDDPALEGATVYIDKMEARNTILEASLSAEEVENTELDTQISGLRAENGILETISLAVQVENNELKTQIAGFMADNGKLEAGLSALRAENRKHDAQITDLTEALESLKDENFKPVIFHAQLGSTQQISDGARVKPAIVHNNKGDAYNPTTGEFTVPYSGYYYITATAGGGTYSHSLYSQVFTNMFLVLDGSSVSYILTRSVLFNEMATCSFAGHLKKGQKLWLKATPTGQFHGNLTSFSGFLVYPE